MQKHAVEVVIPTVDFIVFSSSATYSVFSNAPSLGAGNRGSAVGDVRFSKKGAYYLAACSDIRLASSFLHQQATIQRQIGAVL